MPFTINDFESIFGEQITSFKMADEISRYIILIEP